MGDFCKAERLHACAAIKAAPEYLKMLIKSPKLGPGLLSELELSNARHM